MKKVMLVLIGFMLSFTVGFVYAKDPVHVFFQDKEVTNNGEYTIKDGKVQISEDALKKDFHFSVFYDKNENRVRLYDREKTALQDTLKLFEEFAAYYPLETPDSAAELWAEGIKNRNGAFQYIGLDKSLKEKFKEAVEKRGSWVTGVSSPWIESYDITKKQLNDTTWGYKVTFKAVTSVSEVHRWNANLIISKENNKWRIVNIEKDFDIILGGLE